MPILDYRICTRCVMDTSDPNITFDHQGVCSYCNTFDNVTSQQWFPNEEGAKRLGQRVDAIRKERAKHEYDCILGLSGGIDSSYLALRVQELGLRPLVVHVDAGWNSELAVHNIERIVKHCNYDLHTHVIDWEVMRDLQAAYLRAGVANQDVPQDHAFFGALYHFAVKNDIRYVISGGNIATESVLPVAWGHNAMDAINLKAIHRKHGTKSLKSFPIINFMQYYFYYPFIKKMDVLRPLNFMPYSKSAALKYLQDTVGYRDYGRKHGESVFTRFFQNHYLPYKFGYDKRRAHLASRILSGELDRAAALAALEEPLYDPEELRQDKAYIAKKLGFSADEFEALMQPPGHHYSEYANQDRLYQAIRSGKQFLSTLLGRRIKSYG
ncbi:N-acetyl sugar amidotransferase [Achromobacter sp.]|uniref:N-acetyl sugar amidotransferase n=1 Tax=Achromobacter sp. TaxID=134375 RepID=UPI003D074895